MSPLGWTFAEIPVCRLVFALFAGIIRAYEKGTAMVDRIGVCNGYPGLYAPGTHARAGNAASF